MTTHKTSYRWIILSLLFAGTTLNYLDRIVLGVLLPEIEKEMLISPMLYGFIVGSFQFTYTIGLLGAGWIIDKLGTKLGYFVSIVLWSLSGAAHGLCRSAWSFAAWRAVFGLSAAGNFPAAIKTVSEWFKVEDRAFATSLFNSGSNISSVIGAPLALLVVLHVGWRWTFVVFGAAGFVLAVFWLCFYKKSNIQRNIDNVDRVPWSLMLRQKQTWGIMIGKALTDPVWWFYLFWTPKYFLDARGLDIRGMALAIPAIYTLATLMGFVGGWLPKYFFSKGWSVERARKTTMLLSASLLPISAMAVFANNLWLTIVLISLACGAHNSWSANIFTMCSDCFEAQSVASITGIAGFAGGLGSILISAAVPAVLVHYFGYVPVFLLMGFLHPLAFLFVKNLVSYKNEGVLS